MGSTICCLPIHTSALVRMLGFSGIRVCNCLSIFMLDSNRECRRISKLLCFLCCCSLHLLDMPYFLREFLYHTLRVFSILLLTSECLAHVLDVFLHCDSSGLLKMSLYLLKDVYVSLDSCGCVDSCLNNLFVYQVMPLTLGQMIEVILEAFMVLNE